MITLTQFRQKYPQYADLDDETVAQQLHAKFHSDRDFNEFRSEFFERGTVEESRKASIAKFGPPGTPLPSTEDNAQLPPTGDTADPGATAPQPVDAARPKTLSDLIRGQQATVGALPREEKPGVPWRNVFKGTGEQIGLFGKGALAGSRVQALEAELEAAKRGRAYDHALASGMVRDPMALAYAYTELDKRKPRAVAEIEADIAKEIAGEQARAQRSAELAAPMQDATVFQRGVRQAVVSAPMSGTALVAGLLTRSPTIAAMSMYPLTQAESYGRLRAQGVEHDTALLHSRVQGAAESGTEMIPFMALLSKMPGGKKLLATIAAELPGETMAQLIQGASDHVAARQAAGEKVTWQVLLDGLDEAKEGLPETWVATVLGAAAQTGTVEGVRKIADKVASGKPNTADQDLIREAGEAFNTRYAEVMAELSQQKMPESVRQARASAEAIKAAGIVVGGTQPQQVAKAKLDDLRRRAAAGKKVDPAELETAREEYEQALITAGRDRLASGELPADQQQATAQALADAEAAQPDAEPGVPGKVRELSEGSAKPLSEVETARKDALDRVANADTIESEALTGLVAAGMAKINPQTGRPVLLPAGKRQRTALTKREAAAEAAEKPAKEAAKEAAKPAAVAEKPQRKSPQKPAVVAKKPQAAKPAKQPAKKPLATPAELSQMRADLREIDSQLEGLSPTDAADLMERRRALADDIAIVEASQPPEQGQMFKTRELDGERETLIGEDGKPLKVGDAATLRLAGGRMTRAVKVVGFDEENDGIVVEQDLPGGPVRQTYRAHAIGAEWRPTVTTPTRDARRLTKQIAQETEEGQRFAEDMQRVNEGLEQQMREERKGRTREKLSIVGKGPVRQVEDTGIEVIEGPVEDIMLEGDEPMFMTRDDRDVQETLVSKEGQPLQVGYRGKTFRGEEIEVLEIYKPTSSASSGKLKIRFLSGPSKGAEEVYNTGVIDAEWKPTVEDPNVEVHPLFGRLRPGETVEETIDEKTGEKRYALVRKLSHEEADAIRALRGDAQERSRKLAEKAAKARAKRQQKKIEKAGATGVAVPIDARHKVRPTVQRDEKAAVITLRPRKPDEPMFAARGARDAAQAVADSLLARPGMRAAVDRQSAVNRARLTGTPVGFEQDNPAARGDERGQQWLATKQREAEEDMATAKQRGREAGAMRRGITGSVTAWVREIDLPTSEVRKLRGVEDEHLIRKPGEDQFDRLMANVREVGFNQERSPILITVNHKGEAYVFEGNTRAAVAETLGQPTIRAEVRWFNGGEMVNREWSPSGVQRMTEPMFAARPELPAEGEPLLAPNGKPSKLSREQWLLVRSPEFKQWFGDWETLAQQRGGVHLDMDGAVSKAVDDETQEPMPVYVDTARAVEGATVYSNDSAVGGEPVFLNLRYPYETSFEESPWSGTRVGQWAVIFKQGVYGEEELIAPDADERTVYAPDGRRFFRDRREAEALAAGRVGEVRPAETYRAGLWSSGNEFVRSALAGNNDGAIIRDIIDESGTTLSDTLAAFRPEQAMSATAKPDAFAPVFAAARTQTSPGLSVADVQAGIAEAEASLGVPVRVVATQDELPGDLPAIARARGITIQGAFNIADGNVWLVAANQTAIADALNTYFHEIVGHKGLRVLLGPDYGRVMDHIYFDFREQAEKAAKRNGIKNLETADGQRKAAEEAVAYAAGNLLSKTGGKDERSIWQKMVDYVRGFLLKRRPLTKMKETDLVALIYRARDAIRREAARSRQREFEAEVEKAADRGVPLSPGSSINDGPLLGMPTKTAIPGVGEVTMGPFIPAREAARRYKESAGIRTPEVRTYVRVNPRTGKRIADAYTDMKHDPLNPEVKAAYDAFIRETLAQYRFIKATGLKIEFIPPGQDPYEASPRMAIEDVRNNNHMWVFPTVSGFGNDDPHAEYMINNPMLVLTDEYYGQQQLMVNDVFRAVHDYFGHVQEGNGFRADGEENAWRIHSSMYSPLARAAMATETRGQNSWTNFGPHGHKNRTAKSAATVYAEQKVGLLPPEFWNPDPEVAFAARPERQTPMPTKELARLAHAKLYRTLDDPTNTGFAIDVYGRNPPGDGYMLSTDKTSERSFAQLPTIAEMAEYVEKYRDRLEAGAQFFGGWRADTNRFVLDISTWMADRAEATAAAQAAQQEAIYDLATGEVIYMPGFEPDTTFSAASPAEGRIMLRTRDEIDDTISEIAGLLTPQEREQLNRATAQKLVDLFNALPDEKERGAVALAGQAARGWYRDSAETIADIFGADGPRFVALLAALSPQVNVQSNLKNAIGVWSGWVKAGRPTTPAKIKQIMGRNLWDAQNRKGERVGVLHSWVPNTIRALTTETPDAVVLSGPKVSSFAANLRGEVNEVTLDSWMAVFDKLDAAKVFAGTLNRAGTDPGKRHGYKAVAARVRQTAKYLTEKTGEEWTPAEVQETIWAWTKTLSELSAKYGSLSSAEELVKDGELTNELVNATTDFATLFALPEHQETLRNLGYGERLDRAAQRAAARRGAGREAPPLGGADRQRVLTAARRLDTLRADRPKLGFMGGARMAAEDQGDFMFSALSGNTGNRDLDRFMAGIGDRKRTLNQWWQDTTENLGARAQMAVFDNLYGIKRAGDIAGISAADVGFKNAHLAKSAAELTQATIEYGYPVWLKDGKHWVAGIEGGQGFIDLVRPLGEKINLWAAWMVARRANRLMAEGRERHFDQAGIDAALKLGEQHPEFEVVAKRYAEFQKRVLDFAQEAGVIDPSTRALWEHADYIPFYRIIENGQIQGPNGGGVLGKVRNQIRKLRGGEANIGDPLENIARNWYSLFDASLKAHAARTVVDALDGSGLVTRAPQVEITTALVPLSQIEKFIRENPALAQHLRSYGVDPAKLPPEAFAGLQKMLAVQPMSGEDIISVWRNGKREYWHVHDDLLFESLMNVNAAAWGPLMEFFRFPKRLGTALITSTASFGVKNFWRDMWHTFVQGAAGGKLTDTIVPVLDSAKGLVEQLRKGPTMQALLAGGGSFTHGYIRGGDTRGAAATIRRSLRKISPSELVLDSPAKVWRFYRDLLNAAENAHRVAIYNRKLAAGASRLDAMYEARDLLDFSKRGNNAVVRFLAESVMFLNARGQGLYRLGRGAGTGAAALSIFMRGSLYMLGVLALFWRQKDDERYKALTDADKTAYLHFFDVFAEGDHYRLPVPFEVGTIFGTTPLAIAEAIASDEPDAAKAALGLLAHAYGESLNLSPDIQALWPIVELAINKDTFTEAPILTMGDEAVLPEEQDDPRLSPTIRALAQIMPDIAPEAFRSPKQLNHLVRGYTGPVLDYGLFATDAAVRRMMGEPAPATRTLRDYPDIKAFVQSGPQRMTKYQNAMFEVAEEADRVAASIRRLEKLGTPEALSRIDELQAENAGLLAARDSFRKAGEQVVDLRKAMRAIQLDPAMTPDQKRGELDMIQGQINEIAHSVWDLRPGGKLNPDVAIELMDKDLQGQVEVLLNRGFPDTAEALEQAE